MRLVGRRRARTGLGAILVASTMAFSSVMAFAAPTQDDIDQAMSEQKLAELSVGQLEVQLAAVSAEANNAVIAAQIAAEDLNAAQVALDQATATATKSEQEALQAQTAFEEGKMQLASVARSAYRSGSASLDSLTPYMSAGGLEDLGARQNAISSFGSAADTQLQKVAALSQVADIMRSAADKAKTAEETAYAAVETQAIAAQTAAESALTTQEQTSAQYEVVIGVLAQKRNTTVALEKEYQANLDSIRIAAEQQAAIDRAKAAADAKANETVPSTPPTNGGGGTTNTPTTPNPTVTETPAPWVPETVDPPVVIVPPSSSGVQGAIETAKSLLGSPYVWAGEGPGYDCSGLVTVAFRSVGINLTHQSRSQWAQTSRVPIDDLAAGDLVFWSSNGTASGIYHVAIYLGGGQIIEAPTYGVPVRITSIYNWGQVMSQGGRVG